MKKIAIMFVAAMALASFGCKKKGGGEAMAKMQEFTDQMCACKDADCAKKVSDAMTTWAESQPKDQKVSDDDKKKGEEMGKKLGECMQKAMGMGGGAMEGSGAASGSAAQEGSGAASGSAAPAAGAGDLPAECNEWKGAVEKLASCDKLPQQARDALKNAFDQASASWASMPAEAKANLATACKAGTDAVMQSAKATCGW